MSKLHYDLIVLGSGTAGQTIAQACRDAGWHVALIDNRPPGGTCSQRGCDAKKPLVNAAAAMAQLNRLAHHGIEPGDAEIRWPDLVAFKRGFTTPIPVKTREKLDELGINLFEGEASFTAPDTLRLGDRELSAEHFAICTGLRPRTLGIPGEDHLMSSDAFLELDELPRQIVFVGGGYVSFEFAHAVARAGCSAVILERGERVLKPFDADVVDHLIAAGDEAGIELRTQHCVTSIERTNDGFAAVCDDHGGRCEADLIVHGAGRVASIDGLDLDAAEVEGGEDGVKVDEHLRSVSNPRVYAAGDVSAGAGPPLTPVSVMEAKVVAENLLNGPESTPDYRGIASVVFTVPPLASVGLTEAQAREADVPCRVKFKDISDWKLMQQLGCRHAAFKTIVNDETRELLGAHLLGPRAEEVINLFALAVRHGMTADDLKHPGFAYPTLASHIGGML